MLTARTKDGQYITLATMSKQDIYQLRQENTFYCPACNGLVIVKAGDVIIPHFAHHDEHDCPDREGGEGAYHYKGKLLLYEWLLEQQMDVKLEPYLSQLQQRPDLLLKVKNRIIAIEFQCAKVDQRTIFKRNQGYERANIIPIWILGANLFKRTSSNHVQMNHFTSSFIHRFSVKHPTTLFYFCPQSKQLSIVQDLIYTSPNKALGTQTFIPLSKATFFHLFLKRTFSNVELFSLWRNEKKMFRLRKKSNYGSERKWRNWLYNKHLHIDYLPAHIFLPIRSQYRMKAPLWHWQSRLLLGFIEQIPVNEIFTLYQAEQYVQMDQQNKIDKRLIRYEDHPVVEYLQLLCQTGLLAQVGMIEYKKQRSLLYFKQIEEALAGDNELLNRFMYNRK